MPLVDAYIRAYFDSYIEILFLRVIFHPGNVNHDYQEKLCPRGGHALRARSHRGKEKTTVVVLGSRAINNSKQRRAIHSCTSAMPTRLYTRGRDKRVTEQCAFPLLLYLRTTTVRRQRAMVGFSVANEKQIITILFFELIIFHFPSWHLFVIYITLRVANDVCCCTIDTVPSILCSRCPTFQLRSTW